MKKVVVCFTISILMLGLFTSFIPRNVSVAQAQGLQAAILGDYAGELREAVPRADGIQHVDTPAMIQKLKELHVNTYYFLIWHASTDWDDLRNEFLPAAEKAGIHVVVYLVPPSESKGSRKSYPYTTDYVAWSKAIAELSVQYPNLKGWAIDDFSANLGTFTPEYMAQMKEAADAVNPNLAFTPLMYVRYLTVDFLQTRAPYMDGVIVAYRDSPYSNTQRWASEQSQIDAVYQLLNSYHLPCTWMIYASQLYGTPANPSAEYVRETVQIALDNVRQGKLAGIVTYVLKKDNLPETADKPLFGNGYLSFFLPKSVKTAPGNYISATQTITPDSSGHYLLSFQTMDAGPNVAGYHFKQVLVDGNVVWEQDVAANTTDRQCEPINLDLTPYLAGKSNASLTFRLYDKKGVGNYWDIIGFDRIEAQGFTISNGDFEQKSDWEFANNNPGMIGEILIYDPNRSQHAQEAVKTSYLTYTLYDSISHADIEQGIRNSLTVKARGMMNDYFAEQINKALNERNALSNEIMAQKGKGIPDDLGSEWNADTDELNQLYSSFK